MNKKLILLSVIIGLVGFGGMFAFAWFTNKAAAVAGEGTEQAAAEGQQGEELKFAQPESVAVESIAGLDSETKRAMTEKQLKSLIYEVREKIEGYTAKLQEVEVREQILQKAQDTLKEDIERLNNLRVEIASAVVSLKSEQEKLEKSRVVIAKAEKENMMGIAAMYDKMAADSAGKILININQSQNGGSDDAVKILYYMEDRTKAKVLAAIAETDPEVSAYLCQKLKKVAEN